MHRRSWGLILVALAALLAGALALADAGAAQPQISDPTRCPEHPPIAITEDVGDQGFVLGPRIAGITLPTYRLGSGVVGGFGTADSPYVIQDWCITPEATGWPTDGEADVAIRIEDTSAHVTIRRNTVPDEGSFTNGIVVRNASNVALVANDITGHDRDGIRVTSSPHVDVVRNVIADNGRDGVRGSDQTDLDVRRNEIRNNGADGVRMDEVSYPGIEENTIENNTRALPLTDVDNADIVANDLRNNPEAAISLVGGHQNEIADNEIRASATVTDAIDLSSTHRNTIRGNLVLGSANGIGLHVADGNTVEANTIRSTAGYGVGVSVAKNSVVADNSIEANAWHGVRLAGTGTEVRGNVIAGNAGDGVHVRPTSSGATIEANAIVDNRDGIAIKEGQVDAIHGNDLEANDEAGLTATDVDAPVPAERNWWGHASGPSGSVADACTGTSAEGDGQRIETTNAGVCFEPWLEDDG
jgi:parallel beta-helix repeat protein